MLEVCDVNKKEQSNKYNRISEKNRRKIDSLKLKDIDIVFLDDADKIGCKENTEVQEKRKVKSNLTVNQRIQISFLTFLVITNLIVYCIAFCTRK